MTLIHSWSQSAKKLVLSTNNTSEPTQCRVTTGTRQAKCKKTVYHSQTLHQGALNCRNHYEKHKKNTHHHRHINSVCLKKWLQNIRHLCDVQTGSKLNQGIHISQFQAHHCFQHCKFTTPHPQIGAINPANHCCSSQHVKTHNLTAHLT